MGINHIWLKSPLLSELVSNAPSGLSIVDGFFQGPHIAMGLGANATGHLIEIFLNAFELVFRSGCEENDAILGILGELGGKVAKLGGKVAMEEEDIHGRTEV